MIEEPTARRRWYIRNGLQGVWRAGVIARWQWILWIGPLFKWFLIAAAAIGVILTAVMVGIVKNPDGPRERG